MFESFLLKSWKEIYGDEIQAIVEYYLFFKKPGSILIITKKIIKK